MVWVLLDLLVRRCKVAVAGVEDRGSQGHDVVVEYRVWLESILNSAHLSTTRDGKTSLDN